MSTNYFAFRNTSVAITDILGCVADGQTNCDAAREIGETRYASLYWPEGQYVVSQAPSLAVSWGPGTVFVGSQQAYLRPTPEPARSVLVGAYAAIPKATGADCSAALQYLVNFAQSNALPIEFQVGGEYYVNQGIVFKQGASSGTTQNYFVRIIGNNAIIFPGVGGTAFLIYPQCALENAGTGWSTAEIDISDINFDGAFCNAPPTGSPGPATCLQIGVQGQTGICFEYGKIENVFCTNLYAGSTGLLVQEFQHLLFNRCVMNSGSAIFQNFVAGGFVGDLHFNDCQFTGSVAHPPIGIYSQPKTTATGVTTPYTQARGFHFTNCDIYLSGTTISCVGTSSSAVAQTGDIWFIGCAWDGPGSPVGESAVYWTVGEYGENFGVHFQNSYMVNYTAPAMQISVSSVGTTMENNKVCGTNCGAISPSGAGDLNAAFSVVGASGLIFSDNTFSGCLGENNGGTHTSYFLFDACPGPIQVRGNLASQPGGTAPLYGITINNCMGMILDGNQFNVQTGGLVINQTGTNAGINTGINVEISN